MRAHVIFPPSDCSARVVEPREEALDLPASADATQRSAILGARTATPVCGDYLDAVGRHQGVVEAIPVVAAVADQYFVRVHLEPAPDVGRLLTYASSPGESRIAGLRDLCCVRFSRYAVPLPFLVSFECGG